MERLKRLHKFTPSQLLSTKHLLLVDEISEAHSDDDSFAQAIEKELQRAPGSCWSSDTLKSPSFSRWKVGYRGRGQRVAGKAEKYFREGLLLSFPSEQVTEEADLYIPIYDTIYQPVNVAAEALGLKARQQSHTVMVEEGVQYGIIGSKMFHVFFKRGLPLQDKIVYFSPADENGHHAGGASKYMRDAPSSGRYNLCHKSGPQVEASDQGLTSSRNMKRPLSIPDVDRAHLCITKTNFFNKYAMVCQGVYNGQSAVYKVWDVADACEEDEQDPCWCSIRRALAAYSCLRGNQGAVTCLGWGALHDRTMIFLALKYSGPSLQQQQLSPRWTAGIRAAVEAIHGAGVLHGDLHFGNLVGTDPSYVKLIDFSNASTSGHSLKAQAQERERFLLRLAQTNLQAPSSPNSAISALNQLMASSLSAQAN
ncbi:hypothetical protein WJX82_005467 [Trebouxia sp. C0006]